MCSSSGDGAEISLRYFCGAKFGECKACQAITPRVTNHSLSCQVAVGKDSPEAEIITDVYLKGSFSAPLLCTDLYRISTNALTSRTPQ